MGIPARALLTHLSTRRTPQVPYRTPKFRPKLKQHLHNTKPHNTILTPHFPPLLLHQFSNPLAKNNPANFQRLNTRSTSPYPQQNPKSDPKNKAKPTDPDLNHSWGRSGACPPARKSIPNLKLLPGWSQLSLVQIFTSADWLNRRLLQ